MAWRPVKNSSRLRHSNPRYRRGRRAQARASSKRPRPSRTLAAALSAVNGGRMTVVTGVSSVRAWHDIVPGFSIGPRGAILDKMVCLTSTRERTSDDGLGQTRTTRRYGDRALLSGRLQRHRHRQGAGRGRGRQDDALQPLQVQGRADPGDAAPARRALSQHAHALRRGARRYAARASTRGVRRPRRMVSRRRVPRLHVHQTRRRSFPTSPIPFTRSPPSTSA